MKNAVIEMRASHRLCPSIFALGVISGLVFASCLFGKRSQRLETISASPKSLLPLQLSLTSWQSPSRLPFATVIVMVTTASGWTDRRQRIRRQFPKNLALLTDVSKNSVLLKFLIGREGLAEDDMKTVSKEASQFSDILLLDCLDEDDELKHPHMWRRNGSASSTTSKVLLSVQWAVRHYEFEYLFRLGDDSYLRIDKFMAALSSREFPTTNAVIGHIMTDTVFGMQQLYPQGMGYALTFDVCLFISSNTRFLMKTAPEDCVVARWLFAVGAQFVDSQLWRDIYMGDSCHPDMILAHKLPVELWDTIAANGSVVC